MTLIASWVGVDSKKGGNQVSSVYFASDSRFSWNSQSVYDEVMKVFCSLKYPYIFGYCGDVLFPSHAIERIIYKIDCDLLFGEDVDSFTKKIHIICDEIETSLKQYPMSINFSILFGSRESTYDFHVGQIDYHDNNLTFKELVLPKTSDTIFVGGSGATSFNEVRNSLQSNPNNGTSRFIYHCLSKTIKDYASPTVGGIPQLVGLFREGPGIIFGIIEGEERYVLGKKICFVPKCLNIQWRNCNFERVNPKTMRLKEGAQAQPF